MMKRQPRFAAEFHYDLSLERLVPEDHLLRQIDRPIDFSFHLAPVPPFYSHTGRPSADPVILFKMLLVGFPHGPLLSGARRESSA